jgi:hypothetical protein
VIREWWTCLAGPTLRYLRAAVVYRIVAARLKSLNAVTGASALIGIWS